MKLAKYILISYIFIMALWSYKLFITDYYASRSFSRFLNGKNWSLLFSNREEIYTSLTTFFILPCCILLGIAFKLLTKVKNIKFTQDIYNKKSFIIFLFFFFSIGLYVASDLLYRTPGIYYIGLLLLSGYFYLTYKSYGRNNLLHILTNNVFWSIILQIPSLFAFWLNFYKIDVAIGIGLGILQPFHILLLCSSLWGLCLLFFRANKIFSPISDNKKYNSFLIAYALSLTVVSFVVIIKKCF